MKKIIITMIAIFVYELAIAQDTNGSANATGLRADGKIYVVMAVVLTILAGLIIYLIRLDRKITQLEEKNIDRK
jgi:hypothetical protein